MAAARDILKTVELFLRGEVGVAGAGDVNEIAVVLASGVRVVNDGAERRAAGCVSDKSGEKLRRIGLFARRGPGILPGRAAAEKCRELVHVNREARGKTGDGHADGRAVRLAEDGKLQCAVVKTAHIAAPFRLSSVCQKFG